MKNPICSEINTNIGKKKYLSVLVDPEKQDAATLADIAKAIENSSADFVFIGGSIVSNDINKQVEIIKKHTRKPIVLFPGSILQITADADAILFLSVISGRNPELLIGNHVASAMYLRKKGIEVISTGYIIIGSKSVSSVEYISHTCPIPSEKHDIIVSTAVAGEMLGLQLIYLEMGSGVSEAIDTAIISEVRKNIAVPIISGGGIKIPNDLKKIYEAGADVAVVGNAIEKDLSLIQKLSSVKDSFNQLIRNK